MELPWFEPWVSMEFSYVYAYMTSTWFAYHRHSMKYRGFRPWYFHAKAMEITWTFHWIMVVGTHGIPWNLHGIFICFCPHEITMVYTPWAFHGIPSIDTMVFPWKTTENSIKLPWFEPMESPRDFHMFLPTWNYHGLVDLIAFHGISMVRKPW